MRRTVIRWLGIVAVLALLLAAAATASAQQPPNSDSGADEPAAPRAPAAPTRRGDARHRSGLGVLGLVPLMMLGEVDLGGHP